MQTQHLKRGISKKLMLLLFLTLAAFVVSGMPVLAADSENDVALENLAAGITTAKDSNGTVLTNPEKLTDGDKYYLTYKGSYGPGMDFKEAYKEQSASASQGANWIQLDLGKSYPIEVINLKRRMYDTTNQGVWGDETMNDNNKLNYANTAIVIGNEEDLSDGYVVSCNGNVDLPKGVTKPTSATTGNQKEKLGGTWFYMDNKLENGLGYTKPGVTKTARYIRIYSDCPDSGGNTGGAHWIQLDMGAQHNVESLKLYRYWPDSRQYHNTVVMLFSDANFSPENTLVLWNANGANGGKNGKPIENWPGSGNGQSGNTHTLPTGTDGTYAETADGHTFHVYDSSAKWLDPNKQDPLPAAGSKRFKARYARVYMNGSSANSSNHVVEIEVFGERGKIDMTDTTAPEKVTDIEALRIRPTTADISFLPSMDNMGLKGYEMALTGGETTKEFAFVQTQYHLEDLLPGTEYQVTVTAVDNGRSKLPYSGRNPRS